MPYVEISGLRIAYELLGKPGNPAVAITPGGRLSKDSPGLRELGDALVAGGKRVLLWDRPNCGESDISFDGETEAALQGRVFIELIRKLDLAPIAIGSGSAGVRPSMYVALNAPELVSHLMLWWITGGTLSLFKLGAGYLSDAAIDATLGGMEAVAASPMWTEQIKRNPKNRDIILKQDVDKFIATMERWAGGFIPTETSPMPGLKPEDFARLKMPVLIFRASPKDLYHPAKISEWVHKLIPHSKLVEQPWPADSVMPCLTNAIKAGTGHFLDWPKFAPAILDFTKR